MQPSDNDSSMNQEKASPVPMDLGPRQKYILNYNPFNGTSTLLDSNYTSPKGMSPDSEIQHTLSQLY